MKPQTLKGFRDFLPEEARKRQWLKNKLTGIFELWGYDPIETPTLEYLELFAGQIGEEEKLFFKFKDQGGRDVALRYDQTVPSVRFVAQHLDRLPKPFKRYQIQSAFRAEKPQKGRYREFIQADADIFGDPSPYADAETIALSLDIYRRLGFKEAKALVNDRSLLADFPYEVLVAIDKLKKIGEQGVIAEMTAKGLTQKKAKEYLETVKNLKPNETIKLIFDYLKKSGFDENWYSFDPTIARSFAYSQGPIWEVVIPDYTAGSVLGGERYDGLFSKLFGLEYAGTGFALGFDRTLEAAKQLGLTPQKNAAATALVTVFSPAYLKDSMEIAQKLRANSVNTELFTNPEIKLEKQLKYADRKGFTYAIIVGEREVAAKTATVKNLQTGEQKEIALSSILNFTF